jgi:uncharacterized delta-60 repeat protein
MKKLYTTMALLFGMIIYAQDGTLDATFGISGIKNLPIMPYLQDMIIDSSGKIIIAGGQNDNILIYRLNPDGSFDTTFDSDGIKEIDLGTTFSIAMSVAVDFNDNIIISTNGYGKLVKLLATNGDYDPTFGTAGILTYLTDYDKYVKVAVDYNNKIVVCSYQYDSSLNPIFYNKIQRFDNNGVIDPTFNSGMALNFNYGFNEPSHINGLQIQNDNKIIASIIDTVNVPFANAIKRFNENGTLDSSFNSDPNGVSSTGLLRNIYYDGSNLYCTAANTPPGVYYTATLIKYNNDGTKDTSFSSDGIVDVIFNSDYYNVAYGISVQPDGKKIISATSRIQASGSLSKASFARINLDGSLDTTFGTNGTTSISINTSNLVNNYSAINPINGKLYSLSYTSGTTLDLFRLNTGIILANNTFVEENKITIYPNPTSNILKIETCETINDIRITDLAGRTTTVSNFENNKIDVSNLSNGIYFIKIKTNNGDFEQKFIKN